MKSQVVIAAGCFWGVQFYFDQVPGVTQTVVGYTGGVVPDPTYDAVCTGRTGHAEAVRITYDSKKLPLATLLAHFFRMHDPTQRNRQGADVGTEYRSAIFFNTKEEEAIALKARNKAQEKIDELIVTEIVAAGSFYEAEDYHQKFSQRTGIGMCHVPYEPIA